MSLIQLNYSPLRECSCRYGIPDLLNFFYWDIEVFQRRDYAESFSALKFDRYWDYRNQVAGEQCQKSCNNCDSQNKSVHPSCRPRRIEDENYCDHQHNQTSADTSNRCPPDIRLPNSRSLENSMPAVIFYPRFLRHRNVTITVVVEV